VAWSRRVTPLRLSLVLPCFNGGSYIHRSLIALATWLDIHRGAVGPFELILVDDGSTDDTVSAATATGLPFRLIRHDRNRGKGAAVRSGMLAASGEYRLFVDADLPFDLAAIERVVHYLDVKEFDVCIGRRAERGALYAVDRPASRRLASRVFSAIIGRLVVTGVNDTQCGLKGFRAAAAEYLFRESRVDRFAFDVEILYLAFKNGFDVKAIPVKVVAEERSTLRIARDGIPMLLDVIRLPLRYHRGRYRPCPGRAAE